MKRPSFPLQEINNRLNIDELVKSRHSGENRSPEL